SFANTLANSGTLAGGRYGAGEDVGGLGELVADDVGVHAQRDRGIGVAEPGGDHVDGDASQQQGCRMYGAKIGQPGMRDRLALRIVVGADEGGHKRGHRVWVDRLSPGGREHVVVSAAPLGTYPQPLTGLALAVLPEHLHGVGVDANGAGPAALGGSLDALPS